MSNLSRSVPYRDETYHGQRDPKACTQWLAEARNHGCKTSGWRRSWWASGIFPRDPFLWHCEYRDTRFNRAPLILETFGWTPYYPVCISRLSFEACFTGRREIVVVSFCCMPASPVRYADVNEHISPWFDGGPSRPSHPASLLPEATFLENSDDTQKSGLCENQDSPLWIEHIQAQDV